MSTTEPEVSLGGNRIITDTDDEPYDLLERYRTDFDSLADTGVELAADGDRYAALMSLVQPDCTSISLRVTDVYDLDKGELDIALSVNDRTMTLSSFVDGSVRLAADIIPLRPGGVTRREISLTTEQLTLLLKGIFEAEASPPAPSI